MIGNHIDAPAIGELVLSARFMSHGSTPLIGHDLLVTGPGADEVIATAWHEETMTDWPASPPLQSLQMTEDRLHSALLLSTGLAGNSHWSLSVSAGKGGGLYYDVACRVVQTPDFVGSTYRLNQLTHQFGGDRLAIPTTRASVLFRPVSNADLQTRMLVDERKLVFCPTDISADGRRTLRWAYEVVIEPT